MSCEIMMKLPFCRQRLRERNALDDQEDIADAAARSPSELLAITLSLSHTALALARSATGKLPEPTDLEDEAARYVAPLRAVMQP